MRQLSLRNRQRGVALFISLVLLLVLTIIGVSSVQTTSLEVRMTRNEHDSLLAFQAAESALRDAEVNLEGLASTDDFGAAGAPALGLHIVADMGQDENWADGSVWDPATSATAATNVDGPVQQPRFIIEHIGTVERDENPGVDEGDDYGSGAAGSDRVQMFRITAIGFGATQNARVLLQTTYGRIMD